MLVLGLLLALAAVAWAATFVRREGMDSGPGMYPEELGLYASVWVVMMAAMMFPSLWPAVGLYAGVQRARGQRGTTAAFVGGYLLTWTAAGLAAFILLEAVRSLGIDGLVWERDGHWVAAAVIGLAVVYELTPLKRACLSRCRSPLDSLTSGWREGHGGALRMGAGHGGWCVGCCWALMAALFALGLMSLAWMLVVAVLIATEKLLPWRAPATGAVTAVLLGLAIAVAAAPGVFMG